MDAVAQALADPIRRAILVMLHEAPRTAGTIADAFPVSRPAISRHLRVLREAGLVHDTPSGRERLYGLDADALAPLEVFLARLHRPSVWSQRLDALETEVHRTKRQRETQARAHEDTTRTRTPKKRKSA